MTMIEQVSPFDAATIAFEIRFEQELSSHWQHLESEVASATIGASSAKKHSLLHGFFDDATEEIGRVVHEYFPKLLQIKTTHREQLGNQSPLSWTQAQVLTQVCNFLGMDEKFDQTSPPRDDSRVLNSAARIVDAGIGCLDEAVPVNFLLPGWVDSRWLLSVGLRFKEGSGVDYEPKAPLSRADTLEWVKHRELWLSKKVEQQLENEGWDGIIEAGKTGSSVLEASAAKAQKAAPSSPGAQSSLEVHNGAGSDRIEAIRRKIATHPDGWITIREAAIYYECSAKTIRDWKRGPAAKLSPGPKRSDVSNRSILELDNRLASRKAKKLRSQ
jgi:hypothetical protein